ncbi:MAG: dicarboxylate/amino acid:cation symporter [Candidatus Methylacidiphilales bacterium]|nr:dicarboxylate/amino acid:cation symporter [Candidatus Methylacidiphilales bacterium]
MKKPTAPAHWPIALAILLGIGCGQLTRLGVGGSTFGFGGIGGISLVEAYAFLGSLFLRALQMLIVPLVFSAVISGVAGLARDHSFSRLGWRTLAYYLGTGTLAIVTGLLLVNLLGPGRVDPATAQRLLGSTAGEQVVQSLGTASGADFVTVFLRMVPPNLLEAARDNGQLIGLIFFGMLFGYFSTKLPEELSTPVLAFARGVYEIMILLTEWVLKFAPIGVFGLVAKVSSTTTPADVLSLALFGGTVLAALLIHGLVTLPLLLRFIARVNPWAHYRAMGPALLTAFSTSSSNAALPVSMDCLEHRSGVSRKTISFVIPIGASINTDGTALYECVAVLFIAQLAGVDLSLAQQALVVLMALLTGFGMAGIPSASLVAIMVILQALHLPVEAVGVLLVFDRILDMARTTLNVFGDSCGALMIARLEGEKTFVGRD